MNSAPEPRRHRLDPATWVLSNEERPCDCLHGQWTDCINRQLPVCSAVIQNRRGYDWESLTFVCSLVLGLVGQKSNPPSIPKVRLFEPAAEFVCVGCLVVCVCGRHRLNRSKPAVTDNDRRGVQTARGKKKHLKSCPLGPKEVRYPVLKACCGKALPQLQ